MARYQAKVAERNAQLDNEAAANAQERTRLASARLYREQSQLAGQQNAALAANGVDLGFGSALQVQQDTARIGAEDQAQLYKSGFEEARGFEINAANRRGEAQSKRMEATAAKTKGYFDAASSILGGANQISKYRSR